MAETDLKRATNSSQNVDAFPLLPPGMPLGSQEVTGYGMDDPSVFRSIRQAGENWRTSTSYLRLTVSGTNLVLAPATLAAFNIGSGDALGYGFNSGITAQFSDTDLLPQGAPVQDGQKFRAALFGCEILRPFTTDNTALKQYDAWIDAYRARIHEALALNLAVQFVFGDTACQYYLGTLGLWPLHTGPEGFGQGAVVRNGAGIGPANLMPLRRFMDSGSQNSSDQVTINYVNGYTLNIGQDPVVPFPVGVTSVVVPILTVLYGWPRSANRGVARLEALLAQRPDAMQKILDLLANTPG